MSMDISAMPMGMGFVSLISITSMLIGAVKQILTIYLLFKGIQVANLYLKNNKNDNI